MEINNAIAQAANYIKKGSLVAFPTETVYGLGADALNPIAVAKIFEAKERPTFDPLIVHIASLDDIGLLFEEVNDYVLKIANEFWPGPITIVKKKKEEVPDIVTSGLSTVGVRMPAHPVAQELIKQAGTPIAAPSANKFGMLSPTKAEHVKKQLPEVDFVLDGGQTNVGIESTVIALHDDGFELLRPGAITAEQIAKVVPQSKTSTKVENLVSPGLLKSHYSPTKPLFILGESEVDVDPQMAGFISFTGSNVTTQYKAVEILSTKGDLTEAAVNLFNAMHKLEDSSVDYIVAEIFPEKGVGIAIMDRLRKAAYQYKGSK